MYEVLISIYKKIGDRDNRLQFLPSLETGDHEEQMKISQKDY